MIRVLNSSLYLLTFNSRDNPLFLPETLDSELAEILIKHGIEERFPAPVQAWRAKVSKIKKSYDHERNLQVRNKEAEVIGQNYMVGRIIRNELARVLAERLA